MMLLYLGPKEFLDRVCRNLPGHDIQHAINEEVVGKILPYCDAILDASMKIRFSAEKIEKAPRLKLFVTATTGADHVDSLALEKRRIPLFTLMGQTEVLKNITSAAEHSWLLLMACARQIRAASQSVMEGGWERNNYPGILLRGKTVGIIGCGRIGVWMSHYATAFGMKSLGFDPHIKSYPETIQPVDLNRLFKESDFVTVHVPLNKETRGLLGKEAFKKFKRESVLINTSRGEVVDESALLMALEEGQIAAAGLDVLTGEPTIENHPLVQYAREHPQLIITPHIAGFCPDALKDVLNFSCQRILNFFHG